MKASLVFYYYAFRKNLKIANAILQVSEIYIEGFADAKLSEF